MGHQNVNAVFDHWTGLDDKAFRLLVFMAHTATDRDRQYWGGRVLLARALGMAGDELTNAYRQKVNRSMSTLVKEGALTSLKRGSPGHNALYQLNLDDEWVHAVNPVPGQDQAHPSNPVPTGQGSPDERNRAHDMNEQGLSGEPLTKRQETQERPQDDCPAYVAAPERTDPKPWADSIRRDCGHLWTSFGRAR